MHRSTFIKLATLAIGAWLGLWSPALTGAPSQPAFTLKTYDRVMSEEWYNVLFGERKIGFSFQKIEEGKNGYKITARAVIRMTVANQIQDLSFSQTFYLDKKRKVKGFVTLQKVGTQRQKTVGEVLPGKIVMTVTGIGGSQQVIKKTPENIAFIETLGFTMANSFFVGMEKKIPVFVTSMRAVEVFTVRVTGKERVEAGGKKQDAYQVTASLHGFTTHSLITKEGYTISETEGMLGVKTVKTTEDDALSFSSLAAVPVASLITFSLIRPDKPIVGQQALPEITLVVEGLDSPRAIPRDGRQTVGSPMWKTNQAGQRVMSLPVTIKKVAPKNSLSLKDAAAGMEKFIRPTPEIQSRHPEIIRQANKVVGKEKNAFRAAQKINRWVYKTLDKKLVDSFTALDVLRAKEGECQAHTNLFAALARASGIPTRIAAGIVHSPKEKGFLYHAWPEVYVGEWIAIDPTLGQDVADVTHLKLVEGGLEESLKLVRFIGKIGIKVR